MSVVNVETNDKMHFKKGDCILKSKPFTYVLSSKRKDNHCDHCFKSGKLLKCSGCQYVYYCDRNCQKESWNIHKFECTNLKKILPRTVPDAARLMARIIIKLQKIGGGEEKEYYTKNAYRKFKDLMSHYTDVKNDEKRIEHFVSLCEVLEDFLGSTELPNSAEMLGIYGRVCVNSYNILDSDMNSIGVGIYLGPSVIDHSCKPNAVFVFEGTTLLIRTLVDIPSLNWSQIRISYIDLLNTTDHRRNELKSTYYFWCECERCKDTEIFATAAICSHCESPLDINESSCKECAKDVSCTLKQNFNEVSEFTAHHLETMKSVPYLDISKACLSKQKGLFHPLNIQHVRTIESAFDAAISLTYWQDAENFGTQLLPGYLHYYGEFHPLTGILYFMIGKVQLYLFKSKKALEALKKADKILKMTHGEDHSLVRGSLKPLLYQAIMENQ